ISSHLLQQWCVDVFFQAEDGIRGRNVTGVQTCALPILYPSSMETGSMEGVNSANILNIFVEVSRYLAKLGWMTSNSGHSFFASHKGIVVLTPFALAS